MGRPRPILQQNEMGYVPLTSSRTTKDKDDSDSQCCDIKRLVICRSWRHLSNKRLKVAREFVNISFSEMKCESVNHSDHLALTETEKRAS